jgi:hypothetical protein
MLSAGQLRWHSELAIQLDRGRSPLDRGEFHLTGLDFLYQAI